jgi:hypothetical protein
MANVFDLPCFLTYNQSSEIVNGGDALLDSIIGMLLAVQFLLPNVCLDMCIYIYNVNHCELHLDKYRMTHCHRLLPM